jgi:hypothetical protein
MLLVDFSPGFVTLRQGTCVALDYARLPVLVVMHLR